MANDRYNFLPRLHNFVINSGTLNSYLVESGTYAPLSFWENYHWQNEINRKLYTFNLTVGPGGGGGYFFRLTSDGSERETVNGNIRITS